ncbi:hypothetical protein PYW07_014836 [Mythimna separata]|uniref:Uncharacterized protein n=1 Tax=Mythimna separata TaxID=271217 RepID=A0AAD7Z2N3_MYTSE|nr:hypothetical protein PYW07_014836 [Mythimna separata]
MELHLHLTVAFRALDRKWGKPVDLDTPEDLSTCVPAVVDRPTTTFSSEEYLSTKRRPKPYSRREETRSKDNVTVNDSFADISCHRIPSVPDIEEVSSCNGQSNSRTTKFSVDVDKSLEEYLDNKFGGGSAATVDSGTEEATERGKQRNVFKLLKKCKRVLTR